MKNSIILDTGSTLSLFTEHGLVKNIRKSANVLELMTNAGTKINYMEADVPNFGTVWYDEDAIANIFGFANLVDKHQIMYNSNKEDTFLVHMKDNKIIKFKRTPDGLYSYEPSTKYKATLKTEAHCQMPTVAGNKVRYTLQEIERAT